VESRRAYSILNFCEELHDDIDELYELMLEGTDEEEKKHIDLIIKKLNELNLDRV